MNHSLIFEVITIIMFQKPNPEAVKCQRNGIDSRVSQQLGAQKHGLVLSASFSCLISSNVFHLTGPGVANHSPSVTQQLSYLLSNQ